MSNADTLRIFSGFKSYDEYLRGAEGVTHGYLGGEGGFLSGFRVALQALLRGDYLILNNDHRRLFAACLVFALLAPRPLRRCRLVSVDLLLRPDNDGWRGRLRRATKSLLLRQVDTFVLYFNDWDGYIREYGLARERLRYIPFKANSYEWLREQSREPLPEDYVLCAGATLRDHWTFIEAVRLSHVPAVILLPGTARAEALERYPWLGRPLPPSLRVEWHDDGREETYLAWFARARIVCLPRYRWDIASSGISAAFCAMALGKCVVISEGPGARDVFGAAEAAAFVPSENSSALAAQLCDLWGNHPRRRQIARAALAFADIAQGEQRLLHDLLLAIEPVPAETLTEYA